MQNLKFSPKAKAQIEKLLQMQEDQSQVLRLYVNEGGCAGNSYGLKFDQGQSEDCIENYGSFSVAIDPESLCQLKGLELDYDESLMGKGFSFNNPNASHSCDCGKSFGI